MKNPTTLPTPSKPGDALASPFATWFGCGYAPFAPGTAGSAGAIALGLLLAQIPGWKPWHFAVLAGGLAAPGMWASGRHAERVGKKDPGSVVVDEVLGQWLALAGAPALNWKAWLAAFVLFRAFDIVKPAPARQAEALPGGVGIVADDLVAGAYGALVLLLAGCFNLI